MDFEKKLPDKESADTDFDNLHLDEYGGGVNSSGRWQLINDPFFNLCMSKSATALN